MFFLVFYHLYNEPKDENKQDSIGDESPKAEWDPYKTGKGGGRNGITVKKSIYTAGALFTSKSKPKWVIMKGKKGVKNDSDNG